MIREGATNFPYLLNLSQYGDPHFAELRRMARFINCSTLAKNNLLYSDLPHAWLTKVDVQYTTYKKQGSQQISSAAHSNDYLSACDLSPLITVCFSVMMQAAIGSVSLDVARQKGFTGHIEELYGIQVNTTITQYKN